MADHTEASSQEPQVRRRQPAPGLLFLGDSLTEGYGLGYEESYPAIISHRLQSDCKTARVINAGLSGDTTAGGLYRLKQLLREDKNINWTVLSLGTNDSLIGIGLNEIKANITAMVEELRNYRADISIGLVQLYTFEDIEAAYENKFDPLFAELAVALNLKLFSFLLEGVFGRPEYNLPDGLHPNAAGMRLVADNIFRDLKRHFTLY